MVVILLEYKCIIDRGLMRSAKAARRDCANRTMRRAGDHIILSGAFGIECNALSV